jgi:F0F1-type ATP synthase membrane subunit c/vacuolar-type H+-ATPase subunit K
MMNFEIASMIELASFAGAGLCIGLGALGAALGEGYRARLRNQETY